MGTAQQEIPVSDAKVYVAIASSNTDEYGCGGESWVCSVHRTEETAKLFCQTQRLKQLEEQLKSVKAGLNYEPVLRNRWWVEQKTLND